MTELIIQYGYLGLFLTIFAESGIALGFFLPGDSLLLAAGVAASRGLLELPYLILVCFIGAVAGDQFGYYFGHRLGKKFLEQGDGLLFRAEHVEKTRAFYQKYGNITVALARFVPIVRTFAPIVAGAVNMNRQQFITYNLIGGALWSIGLSLIGYWLGDLFPGLGHYLDIFIILVVVSSLGSGLWHVYRDRQHQRRQSASHTSQTPKTSKTPPSA